MAGKRPRHFRDWRRDPQLTDVDRALLEQIEALYGPPASTQRLADASGETGAQPPRRVGLVGQFTRTLLLLSAAFLAWYALAGGEASVQHTVGLLIAKQQGTLEAPPLPEYVLAVRTMHVDRLAPDDPLVLQFKSLLDALAPKCKESRTQLAKIVIDVYAARVSRGVETPYLSILAQVDASLPEQTRSRWPTSCGELLARL